MFFFLQFLLFLFNLCGGFTNLIQSMFWKNRKENKNPFFFLAFNPISS